MTLQPNFAVRPLEKPFHLYSHIAGLGGRCESNASGMLGEVLERYRTFPLLLNLA
jgi:hypothetical protein